MINDEEIKATIAMKYKIHKKIDYLWKNKAMTRGEVYKMMRGFLGGKSFHVADLSYQQCKIILDRLQSVENGRN